MSDSIWAERAPDYKKEGKMYSSVEFDDEGNPTIIRVAQDQLRKGQFRVEGSTAIYEKRNIPTHLQADEEVKEYVKQLDFVDSVEM